MVNTATYVVRLRLASTGRMSARKVFAVNTADAISQGHAMGKVYEVTRVVAMLNTDLTTV